MAFQKTNAAIVAETSTSYNSGVRIKQRPVMTLQNPIGTSRKEQYKRENNKRQNNTRPKSSVGQAKPCKRCGSAFNQGHLKTCMAMGKTCNNCVKPNHFASE